MPEHEVGTYPQSIVNVKNIGGLRGVLLGGLLTATGAGGALGIASLLGAFQKQPAPVVEKQVWRGKLGIGYSQDGDLEVDLDGKPVRVSP